MSIIRLPARPAWLGATVDCQGPLLNKPDRLSDDGYTLQYGMGIIHQVSPTQVVMLATSRVTGVKVGDFEAGWQVLVFDRFEDIGPASLKPGMANTDAVHPRNGQALTMVHHVPQIGFIPLGAKLPDGSPHPHAGTGFGVAVLHGYPKDNSVKTPHIDPDMHSQMQLLQFAFDGEDFIVTKVENLAHDELIAGYHTFDRGLRSAVPDVEDLLMGMIAGKDDQVARDHAARLEKAGRKPYYNAKRPVGECYGSGLARFRRGSDGWRCVDFTPVPRDMPDMAFEPSLVRDADGSLLMAVRGTGANVAPGAFDEGLENTYEHFRVYRSADHGKTWQSVIHAPEMRSPTPVTINTAADGTVFLAGNPFKPLEEDSHGGWVMKIRQREYLWLWPLTADRRGLEQPIEVLNCRAVLGPPRERPDAERDNRWHADHPMAEVIRLADGKWHTLMGFRLTDADITSYGGLAHPQAGAWFSRIHCEKADVAPWRF